MLICDNINFLLKKNNVSVSQVSDFVGVSDERVLQWKSGEILPELCHLPRLADMFQVTIDDLVRLDMKYGLSRDDMQGVYLVRNLLDLYEVSRKKGLLALKEEIKRDKYQSALLKLSVELITDGLSIAQAGDIIDRYIAANSTQGFSLLEASLIKEGALCILGGERFTYIMELLCSYFSLDLRKSIFAFCNIKDDFVMEIERNNKFKDKKILSENTNLLENYCDLDPSVLQEALLEIDNQILESALKGASEGIITMFLNNLSPGLSYFVSEGIDCGSVETNEIMESQKKIVRIIERVATKGKV